MNNKYTDEKLNLFIDEQLDTLEMEDVHQAILKDQGLREHVCQLRATRELVRFAYEAVPVEDIYPRETGVNNSRVLWRGIAAGVLLTIGVMTGWASKGYIQSGQIISATDVFQYFKYKGVVDRTARKIVVHVTTGDVYAVKDALDEVEQLLASYGEARLPVKLDIVTYREGINILRVNSSPYIKRIETLLSENESVSLYACQQSISKARERWGDEVVLMPQTVTSKTAQEIISERIKEGWVYIKV